MSDTLHQRQLRRGIMQLLAKPLEGEARAHFLATSERSLNRDLPIDKAMKRRAIRPID